MKITPTQILGFLLALPTMYLAWSQYERFVELSEENAMLEEIREVMENTEENEKGDDLENINALITLICKKKLKFFGK